VIEASSGRRAGRELDLMNQTRREAYVVRHQLSPRQVEIVLAGS
jgi:hypothetical protein